MKVSKKPYKIPRIRKKRIFISYLSINRRLTNSLNPFDNFVMLACGSGGCGCFLADTKVTLTNGKTKNIKEIKISDQILSYDISNKQYVSNKVKKLLIHRNSSDSYVVINKSLKVTHNHRLWINNSSWKRVDDLKFGDMVYTLNHNSVVVESIKQIHQSNIVYNLELIDEPHNFFAEKTLVHNGVDVGADKSL